MTLGQSACHCHKLYCLLYVMLLNTVVVLCHIITVPYGLACIIKCESDAFPGYTHFFLHYATG